MPDPEEISAITALLKPLRSPCVVELGAHTGEDESWIRGACSEACHYIMVEPDPRNCQAILDHFRALKMSVESVADWQLGQFSQFRYSPLGSRRLIIGAIADEVGMREFNFSFNVGKDARTYDASKARTSGSLREPTGHLRHFSEIHFPYKGMVQCYTLDWIFEHEWLTKIDLLWVDIQGAEDMMIRGGQKALKHSRYLFMEVEKEELYAGEKLGHELIAMLPGWQVVQEFRYNVLMKNNHFQELLHGMIENYIPE